MSVQPSINAKVCGDVTLFACKMHLDSFFFWCVTHRIADGFKRVWNHSFWREQIGQFFPTQIHCKHLTRKIENVPLGKFPFCALKSRISETKQTQITTKKIYFFVFVIVFEINSKKSHSTLRAKRATFTFWVDKSQWKMPTLATFWKPEGLRSNSVTG